MNKGRAFSIIELLAILIVFVIVFIVAILRFSSLDASRKKNQCFSNMRKLSVALNRYMMDNSWSLPMASGIREQNDGAIRVFDPQDRKQAQKAYDIPSPTADLWLLVRNNFVDPGTFICPVTNDTPDPIKDPKDVYDFLSSDHLSYAYQNVHDPDMDVNKWMAPELQYGAQYAIMADANPYIKGKVKSDLLEDRNSKWKGNSLNHSKKRDGQTVGFMDGHVDSRTSPDTGAPSSPISKKLSNPSGRDNIYTSNSKGENGTMDPGTDKPTTSICNPGTSSDACLVP